MKRDQQPQPIKGLNGETINGAKPKKKTIFIKVPPKPFAPRSSLVVIRQVKRAVP